MDDNLSIKSSDSATTSGEYEIVPEALDASVKHLGTSPTLNIANNGNIEDLKSNLNEVIHELDRTTLRTQKTKMDESAMKSETQINERAEMPAQSQMVLANDKTTTAATEHVELATIEQPTIASILVGKRSSSATKNISQPQTSEPNKVGQSIFYDCADLTPSPGEKQDDMKTERSDTDEEMSDIDQDCTSFSGVTYLASATINAPKSETEIQRKISELNTIHDDESVGLKVSISIPFCAEGFIVLHDAARKTVIAHYEVNRILYYARGPPGTNDEACFAFTWANGDSVETTVFQCHVFRCHIPEAVNRVSSCFAQSFQRLLPSSLTNSISGITELNSSIMTGSITSDATGNQLTSASYEFNVSLQIREKIAKNYTAATRDRSCFKLRCNTDKEIQLTVKQTASVSLQPLLIERCFGVLLSPGKLVRQADMQLLDMAIMGYDKPATSTSHAITSNAQAISPLSPYVIRAEWKAGDKNFEQLNAESAKTDITVAVDLVIKGIREPVRFIIETTVVIQPQNEIRIMDHFNFSGNKKSMLQRFYLQLKDSGEGSWEVVSIDPTGEIIEQATPSGTQSALLKNLGISSFSKMVRSTSAISIEQDDSADEYSSDGDEPLLSGTGEVSMDCSQETLDEWKPMLGEWNEKRPKSLATLVRSGIPEALRGNVWQRLVNVEDSVKLIDMYRVLLTKETSCESVISRDIHRTFPAHKRFKEMGGAGQDGLFKVSKAYAVYDSEVGYCQGLSFVAATLLLHMPEEQAFSILVSLMYDYGLRDLYKDGFDNLYLRLYQLSRLIQDQLPKLHEHFAANGVETHMFASQWFLTLFTARFPLYFVFHIMDVVLLDGIDILFQVAMTLLEKYESELRQQDFEGVLRFFRVTLPKKCRNTSNARKLMKAVCDRKIKKLKHYKEEYMANKEAAEKEEQAMKQFEQRFDNERNKYKTEILALQDNIRKCGAEMKRKSDIIDDYKQIIQRREQQVTEMNNLLTEYAANTSKCSTCSTSVGRAENESNANTPSRSQAQSLDPLSPLAVALDRVRELELELAQTKLAHVEAQCQNQDLNHQLNTTLTEIQNQRNSWQPWLSKTFNTLQEKVASSKRDAPTFQSYTCNSPTPSCNSLDASQESPSIRHRQAPGALDTGSGRNSLDQTKAEANTNTQLYNSIK